MKYENKKTFKEILNDTVTDTALVVRDINLSKDLEERYIPGTIILERGFTDASYKVGGMLTSHRYAIITNKIKDLSEFEHGTNWGLVVANFDSHYLVLDKYTYKNKTLITLLHLPNNNYWKMFKNIQLNIFNELITASRKNFQEVCESEPIPELSTNEWLKRCSEPLGMDRDGNYFDLNVNLSMHLCKIGKMNFRDLLHKIIYIQLDSKNKLDSKIEILNEDDGFLAYGYIDYDAGFSFQVLCSANIRNNKLSYGKIQNDVGIIIRKNILNSSECINMDYCDIDFSQFRKITEQIDMNYKCFNKQTEEMRNFRFLDTLRNADFPDDIQVLLLKEGFKPEQVWVKCWKYTENELFGILLNEPDQNFEIHHGYTISFAPTRNGDEIICFYTGKYYQSLEN